MGKNSRHSAAFQYEGVQLNGQHCKGFLWKLTIMALFGDNCHDVTEVCSYSDNG